MSQKRWFPHVFRLSHSKRIIGENRVEPAQPIFFECGKKAPKFSKNIFFKNWAEPAQPVVF